MITIVVTLALSISAYTPSANAISGGKIMANGKPPHVGAFACPANIPLGALVSITGKARERAIKMGLPTDGTCTDRFDSKYKTGHFDICLPQNYLGMDNKKRLHLAKKWGRVNGAIVFSFLKDKVK